MTTESVWRWNVDDIWQSYSSMYLERHSVESSSNDIERYHHLSASLLFGQCALESLLNAHMRAFLEDKNTEQTKIFHKLRWPSLWEKTNKWPAKMGGSELESNNVDIIFGFLHLRNEVAHRKRRDHSLYKELDETDIGLFISAIQRAFLDIYTGLGKPFPYWLLGWNFVGMNHDETWPCLLNNGHFKHALKDMGFEVPASDYYAAEEWEQQHMTSEDGFRWLEQHIYNKAPEIQPRNAMLPDAPRLCKRWWDKELIKQARRV